MRKHLPAPHNLLSLLSQHIARRQAIQQIHAQLLLTGAFHSINPTLCNPLLRHYSLGSFPQEAILLFKHLQLHPLSICFFDSFAYSFLIKAAANLQDTAAGNQLHALTFRAGFQFHVYVQTALLNMYADCGSLVYAKQVFDEMPQRNLVTWNAMITAFAKWGDLRLARSMFEQMPTANVVSWTALIAGYTRANNPREALALLRRMVMDNGIVKPNEVTVLAVLPAICNLGRLESCQSVHAYIEKSGFTAYDIQVANSLIDTYAKCGCINSAFKVFEAISHEKRTLVSWTSIISGFAMHGMGKQAADSFKQMKEKCLKPNQVTFLSILNACSHGGLVKEGIEFFRKMVDECQILPDIKHYGCLIDMLGRAGWLEEAEKISLQIPGQISNVVIWRTLLGACQLYGDVQMAERVVGKIMEMEMRYGGDYVLFSNIVAGSGKFEDVEKVRRVKDERNASKVLGISMV
ncbi:pentatricopeptide repeat-containing protein At1g09220, mitochondrial [Diospyros lotus]|uniref:pentatricopeptide repeat-containing protein At1g09220, mitochondrial n=1 Tax=Diospyros lotus TaxID=55363 RepID=UPI002257707F|nr:pentatricopeptide repeat-containing protein At1g09220, mitochondrial [Diospyros lotus]